MIGITLLSAIICDPERIRCQHGLGGEDEYEYTEHE